MKKKMATLFLPIIILAAVTACGGDEEEPTAVETFAATMAQPDVYDYGDDDSDFEEYLKENDPDSYNSYQDAEENWNSGDWDSENGFFDDSNEDSDFEEFLKENDPDSYDFYQDLENNWNSGNWDSENGFFGS